MCAIIEYLFVVIASVLMKCLLLGGGEMATFYHVFQRWGSMRWGFASLNSYLQKRTEQLQLIK